MVEAVFSSEYFQEKILSLRQRLHAMDGFEPIENISENITSEQAKSASKAFISGKEKESHEK